MAKIKILFHISIFPASYFQPKVHFLCLLPLKQHFGSKKLQGDDSAGFSIGQGMMMTGQIVATSRSYGLQLMIGQYLSKVAARGLQGIAKAVAGPFHAIHLMYSPQASLIKACIMSHEGYLGRLAERQQPIGINGVDSLKCLRPYHGEDRSRVGIARPKPVNTLAEGAVIIGLGMDETIERIHNTPAAHHHKSYGANAAGLSVGRFEIYGYKILHTLLKHNAKLQKNRYSEYKRKVFHLPIGWILMI